MKNILLFLFLFLHSVLSAQVATSIPALPADTDEVKVVFDVSKASGNLAGYTGEVYVHTGVLTDASTVSSDWKYVQTAWGQNTAETKTTRIGTDLYEFNITPNIREFYGVPAGERITHIAFVLRSDLPYTGTTFYEAKEAGGADIFIEVFEPGLSVSIIVPATNVLAELNAVQDFEAASNTSADLSLYLNNDLVKSLSGNNITHSFNFNQTGDFWLKVTASADEEFAADSVFVHILGDGVSEPRPTGLNPGFNETDAESGILLLYAPGKEYVFVTGDFNSFTPSGNYRMKKDTDYFWLEISDLVPGEEYAYQYFVDGEITIADPFTEKVLDPWNDRYIPAETYPGLKEYPHDYTDGIVSVLQTNKPEYQWSENDFIPADKQELVIYELLLRDFIAAHDWKTLTDTLNYFTSLGVNAIELLPVNEFEGNESWGYNPSFYFATDKYYGPADDLKEFIDSCHNRGISVIIDMVLNHSYGQSPLVQLYWNNSTGKPSADNPWYNVDSPNTVFSWGYDFDHESQATKDFVDMVNTYWLNEYKVDGFRFDFTKGFTNTPGDGGNYDASRIAILKRMADEIWVVNPDAYVILEHLAPNTEEKDLAEHGMMLWGNLNYNYNEATMGWNEAGKSDFNWISYQNRGWDVPHLVGYMESHDEERLMYKNLMYGNSSGDYDITMKDIAKARIELAAVFFFPVPGPKMIWQFGDMAYDYSIDYNGRVGNKPIRWDYYRSNYRVNRVFSTLIKLKTTEPAFSTSDYVLDVDGIVKRISLNHADMDVRIIGNFGVTSQEGQPAFSSTGVWYEYFTGESLQVTATDQSVQLEPGEYRMYTTKFLQTPQLPTSRESKIVEDKIVFYPNPATEVLYFESDSEQETIKLVDLTGRIVKVFNPRDKSGSLNLKGINPGVYLILVEGSVVTKVVLR